MSCGYVVCARKHCSSSANKRIRVLKPAAATAYWDNQQRLASCHRTDLDGSWKPGKSKIRTFNAKLDQEVPAQTSWCFEWAVHVSKPSSM
jgi:hypothetical protein